MAAYIIKRVFYSLLIILGIVMLTFILFRVAAGDPAAALLGKNPSPQELENLRNELGANKPLFFGNWRATELYSKVTFDTQTTVPGVSVSNAPGNIPLRFETVRFSRNFLPASSVDCAVSIRGSGEFIFSGQKYDLKTDGKLWLKIPETAPELDFKAVAPSGVTFKEFSFFIRQSSPFDSQAFDAVKEIICFKNTFPYISFFNFGKTLITRESVRDILFRGMGPSLAVMIPVFIGELIAGILLALVSVAFKDRFPDFAIVFFSTAGMSISYLVFIIFGQWYLGYYYNIFPVWGYGDLKFLILPVIIGIISGTGSGVRFYRTVFIHELNREYLRTAVAKGLAPWRVYVVHMLKNAMIPIITRASSILPFLFTGSLLLETFFGIPGLGYAGINALNNSDLQMLKALVTLGAFMFVTINLITDIAYAWADPRIRLK